MPSSFQIFETAERIERLAAEIYRALADQFAADAEARKLFLSLEEEEIQHASRIRLVAVRYMHDSRLFGRDDFTGLRLEEILENGQRALGSIARGEWNSGLSSVKQKVAELEASFSAAHAHILSRCANPAVREFFEKLAEQDEAHHRLLVD